MSTRPVTGGPVDVEAVIDGWQLAWSDKDSRRFDEVCASGVTYEDPLTDTPLHGVDALATHAHQLWSAFPDARLEQTGARLTGDGGKLVAAPCKLLGTHRAPLGGLPASNRFVVVHCLFYCELQGSKLLRVRGFFDVYDAAVQMGVLPKRGTVGEKALLILRGFGLRAGAVSVRIAIPVFDDLTALDAIGPYEVLSRLPDASVVFCARERGPVRTENQMLAIVADAALSEIVDPDVVVVPGGLGTRALLTDAPMLDWLTTAAAGAQWVTSVCTGSLLLGAAGLLTGRRATTHWLELESLRQFGAVPVSQRVVREGTIVTAAGVCAGIDMALSLAAWIAGEQTARAIQLGIEYDPAPPFDCGSVDKAGPELTAYVRARRSQLA